jgi:hypothetical protein
MIAFYIYSYFFHRGAVAYRRYEMEENIQVVSPGFAIFLAVKSHLPHFSLI